MATHALTSMATEKYATEVKPWTNDYISLFNVK